MVKNRTNSMGKKGGRSYQKKEVKNSKTSSQYKHDTYSSDDMDDEIDTCNSILFIFIHLFFSEMQ